MDNDTLANKPAKSTLSLALLTNLGTSAMWTEHISKRIINHLVPETMQIWLSSDDGRWVEIGLSGWPVDVRHRCHILLLGFTRFEAVMTSVMGR